ncbi:MAG TPA: hypothetical protein VLM79_21835 [Kofleriaceae bacterium]|nr:hypothetical protein [Kofleriaceae bacterium]
MKARWIALLLVLAITPGVMEVVELAVHWTAYGDVADAAGDTHNGEPLGKGEHGCSGTFHLGSCANNQLVPLSADTVITVAMPESASFGVVMNLVALVGCLPPSPALRPPIA